MKTLTQLLKELNACKEAVKFSQGKTIEQAVKECSRGNWMLWLASVIKIDHRKLTLAKAHCANTVRHLMEDNRGTIAVDTAIAYGEGKASKQELNAAADAAAAAVAAADAAAYAASADAYAAGAAAAAANAAAYAAAYAASADARKENMKQTADICRKYIGQDIIDKVNAILS